MERAGKKDTLDLLRRNEELVAENERLRVELQVARALASSRPAPPPSVSPALPSSVQPQQPMARATEDQTVIRSLTDKLERTQRELLQLKAVVDSEVWKKAPQLFAENVELRRLLELANADLAQLDKLNTNLSAATEECRTLRAQLRKTETELSESRQTNDSLRQSMEHKDGLILALQKFDGLEAVDAPPSPLQAHLRLIKEALEDARKLISQRVGELERARESVRLFGELLGLRLTFDPDFSLIVGVAGEEFRLTAGLDAVAEAQLCENLESAARQRQSAPPASSHPKLRSHLLALLT